MGVTQLWQILSPVQEHQSLTSLEGLVLAVDLSIWICESDGVRQMHGVVSKPYLRNLFFRILHLTQIGVKLVFVIEGSAPELKWEIMAKRQQSRFPGRQAKQTATQKPPTKQTRKNFNAILRECCELLDILGIPYIQSKGEAEAMCALLNSSGLVDGCLTDDGDAFLYGAKTVYRNFTMNAKDPHVERYQVSDIEASLGIDRNGLVALALLLGCDFVPKGVPGIGMANAVKLLDCLKGRNVLERLQDWRRIHESQCLDPIEKMVRKKALNAPDFPQIDVIHEFLHPKDRCPSRLSPWKRPVIVKLQEFALIKLEWPVEYTLEKILPLVTLWDMQDVLKSRNPSKHQHLRPHRIVKNRVRQGIPCYEIEWVKPVTDPYHDGDYYVTIESQEMFTACYPTVVQNFLSETNSKNKKKKSKKKKTKEKPLDNDVKGEIQNLSFNFGKLNIKSVTRKLQESLQDLQPSFTDYEGSVLTTKVKQSTITASTNKVSALSNSHEYTINMGTFKEEGQSHPINVSDIDEADLPLSERIQLRLKRKNQKPKNVEKESVSSVTKGLEMLSLSGGHSSSKGKRKKNKARNRNEENSGNCGLSGSVKDLSFNSPVSPFVNSAGIHHGSGEMKSRKMSSPASNTFCSPGSFIKQSVMQGNEVFKDSPIQSHVNDKNTRTPKTTLTNFRFFDSLEMESSPSNYKTASQVSQSIKGSVHTTKPSTPALLKGEWQTEFIEDYLHELSKDLTLNANRAVQSMTNEKISLNNVLQSQQSTASNGKWQMSEQAPTQINNTQEISFGDFKLESSLLNSLCASLIQTLTPKGMNKEQYDNLCESLRQVEQGGITAAENLENTPSEHIASNIDFKQVSKASSKTKGSFRSDVGNKSSHVNDIACSNSQLHIKGHGDVVTNKPDGLSKSARKRLKKKQRSSRDGVTVMGEHDLRYQDEDLNSDSCHHENSLTRNCVNQFVLNHSNLNSHIIQHKGETMMKVNNKNQCSSKDKCQGASNVTRESQKQFEINTSRMVNYDAADSEDENAGQDSVGQAIKKKKKKRKKKIRKASPAIDLSADTSTLDEPQYKICSEYLKKALETKPKPNTKVSKIEKASPVIDISADDTFFELDILSSCLSGDKSSLDTDIKRKLALKKKLSNKQKEKEEIPLQSMRDRNFDGYQDLCENEPCLQSPVFSMQSVFSNDKVKTDYCVDMTDDNGTEVQGKLQNFEVFETETERNEHFVIDSRHDMAATNDTLQENREEEIRENEVVSPTLVDPKKNTDGYDEEILKAMEDILLSFKSSVGNSPRKDPISRLNVRECTRMYTASQRVCNKNSVSKHQSLDDVFSHQRIQDGCRLDIKSLSNDAQMSDIYERNIQSCKDLRSWSMLPSSSKRSKYRENKPENSLQLRSAFNLHGIHRHENKRHDSTFSCNMHNGIMRKPVCKKSIKSEATKAKCIPDVRDIAVDDSDCDGQDIDHDTKIRVLTSSDDDHDDKINDVDSRKLVDNEDVENGCEMTMDACSDSLNDINDLITKETLNTEEEIQDKDSVMGHIRALCEPDIIDTALASDADQRFHDILEIENLFGDTDAESPDFVPTDILPAVNLAVGCGNDNSYLLGTNSLQDKEESNFDVQNNSHPDMNPENITKPKNSPGIVVIDNTFMNNVAEKYDSVEKVCNEHGIIVIEENDEEETNEQSKKSITKVGDNSTRQCNNGFVNDNIIHVLLTEKTDEFLKHVPNGQDIESSSDKENERGIENNEALTNTDSSGDSSTITPDITNQEYFPCSSSTEDESVVERASSPVPLLDRLKMKFKKSSARSVLHSFTNGR